MSLFRISSEMIKEKLKSVKTYLYSPVTFINKSDNTVSIYWIDYDGDELLVSALLPNGKVSLNTQVNHKWIVRDINTGKFLMLKKDNDTGSGNFYFELDYNDTTRSNEYPVCNIHNYMDSLYNLSMATFLSSGGSVNVVNVEMSSTIINDIKKYKTEMESFHNKYIYEVANGFFL
uniref:VHL domain-containing protein n=1 Tax=Parastrongyloides trichosuri TaxID=131310 RepID=A0A0N4ZXI5_PARTI